MLSTFFQSSCEIKLHLLQNVLFLHPPESGTRTRRNQHDAPPVADDELVRGLVELQVPSDRHIGGIRVRLRASEMIGVLDQQTLTVPVSWDERIIMDKTLEIGVPTRQSGSRSRSRAPPSRPASPRRPSRPVSRAPSHSRAPSPGADDVPRSRRNSTDESELEDRGRGREERGRATSRDASRSRRDQSVSGLAGALAVAMRGRSSTRGPESRSASKTSRPPSPPARGRTSQRAPSAQPQPVSGLFNSSTVPGRRSVSTHHQSHCRPPPMTAGDDEELRGRASDRPTVVPEKGLTPFASGHPPRSRDHLLHHHSSFHDSVSGSRSSSAGFFNRTSSRSRPPDDQTHDHVDPDDPEAVEEEGMFVAKGIHGFEFGFILPCNAAPFERSPYGRVRYTIKATAIGAGRAKSNTDTVREIFPMTVPSIESPSTPMVVMYHDMHPTVGLLSIACTSNNISVGGIFNIDVHSPNPPPDLVVYMVRVSLETTVDLYTAKRGKQTVPVLKHRLFEKGMIPHRPADLEVPAARERVIRWHGNNHAWSVQGIARLPDDNQIRPTTLPGSKSDIRFSHTLVVEVIHSRDPSLEGSDSQSTDRKLKAFALRQPVILPSCCVAYNAVTLPRYEEQEQEGTGIGPNRMYRVPAALSQQEESAWAVAAGPLQPTGHDFCVCGMSLADLEAKERNMLPRTPGYDVPINSVRNRGKIGDYLPVDDSATRRNASVSSSSATREGETPSTLPTSTVPTASSSSSSSASPAPLSPISRPTYIRSASSRSVRQSALPGESLNKEGLSAHLFDPSLTPVRDDGLHPVGGMPLAPTPGASGMTTPHQTTSRSRSRVRTYQPDLSGAIPRLNDLAETAEHEPRGLPPAYDTVVDADAQHSAIPSSSVVPAPEEEFRGRSSARP